MPEIQHRRRQSFFFFFGHRIELQRRDLGIPIFFFSFFVVRDRLTLVSGSDSFHKLDANVANSFCPYFEGGIDCCTVGYNKDAKEKC